MQILFLLFQVSGRIIHFQFSSSLNYHEGAWYKVTDPSAPTPTAPLQKPWAEVDHCSRQVVRTLAVSGNLGDRIQQRQSRRGQIGSE
jgi:hypothetical protein